MKNITTHYDNLQVTHTASASVIRAAFKALSQKWHPDKHQANLELAQRNYLIIKRAYEVLSDPEARLQHDLWIKHMISKKVDRVKASQQPTHTEKKQSISVIV